MKTFLKLLGPFLKYAKSMFFFMCIEVALYLCISFSEWQLDAGKWNDSPRFLFALISGIVLIFMIIMPLAENYNHTEL